MAGIEIDRVGKVYADGTRAVTDLSIDVMDGEFLVLVGPSGCGKTTALRMVAGLEEITEYVGKYTTNYPILAAAGVLALIPPALLALALNKRITGMLAGSS